MRTLVMGDIHGAYKALEQCLERSGFDKEGDVLIQLGDVVDGHAQTYECIETLLSIKHLISIKGNHDDWFHEFIKTGYHPSSWDYGGEGTLISYLEHTQQQGRYFPTRSGFKTSLVGAEIPLSHRTFFDNQKLYHVDQHNRCFVHGGFQRDLPFYEQDELNYYWDRSLWRDAMYFKEYGEILDIHTKFLEIYVGHTATTHWGTDQPMQAFNIFNLDTGAGHHGRLTIMDIGSKECWQSDLLPTLYAQNYRK